MSLSKITAIILSFITLLTTLVACSNNSTLPDQQQSSNTFQVPPMFTTYNDPNGLFSVSYPGSWKPFSALISDYTFDDDKNNLKAGMPIDRVVPLFKAGIEINRVYNPSIMVAVQPIPSGVSNIQQWAGYISSSESNPVVLEGKEFDVDYRSISLTETTVNNKNALLDESSKLFPSLVDSSSIRGHLLTLWVWSDKYIWCLVCLSDEDNFNQYKDDFNNIVRSFNLIR
ncbi:MAG: hypothetical protein JW712_04800 [Dehalococcoidales bacterium]|nr:hypothetical protein [Dehalococcoidales bacterium]